jgi:hypothetical protein
LRKERKKKCVERENEEREGRGENKIPPPSFPLAHFSISDLHPPIARLPPLLVCCPLPPSPPPLSRDSNTFLCSWAKAHHEVRG